MKEKLLEAIEIAKLHGCPWVEVDGVKIPLVEKQVGPKVEPQSDDEVKMALLDPEPDLTDEEVLFWSTPYFDELQEKKLKRQDVLREEKQLRDEEHNGKNS